ncbi:hypothetical protein AVEN_152238-1 [Araneus ventricosus]|uniref:Integrase catalytic domain-containing protein n=1 Tax=Araneus ventricosus TaxID=182803 RepID=A0A4Y2KD26_ARAVE|nr:hypothetical protein AVEN_152238-1 [Araneus ventricosus]
MSGVSTEAFLMALRRFVARRGRFSTIYCHNGTNFVGAANILCSLDWKKVINYVTVNAIDWKFNPPTAAWWGGWWVRLIRIIKDLKRVLDKACLSHEEMMTVLFDYEAIINSSSSPTFQKVTQTLLLLVRPCLYKTSESGQFQTFM